MPDPKNAVQRNESESSREELAKKAADALMQHLNPHPAVPISSPPPLRKNKAKNPPPSQSSRSDLYLGNLAEEDSEELTKDTIS